MQLVIVLEDTVVWRLVRLLGRVHCERSAGYLADA